MISFDYITLKAFFNENKEFFTGARLQKIQQPSRRDFVLSFRGYESRKLYINIDPQVFHVCFLSDESYNKRNITIPKKPPMFCMLLRKHLEGFRVTDIRVPAYERILEIYFESYNELNEKIKLCLAIELMGKYSNVILYNCDTNIIIGCAHNVGTEKSRERELAGTIPYVYPQKQDKTDILSYNGEIDYSELNQNFMGISQAFENQLYQKKISLEKIKKYVSFDSNIKPGVTDKEFSVYSELLDNPMICNTVNEMIDIYFSNQQEKIIKRALRLKLKNLVSPQYKKEKNLYEKLSAQLNRKNNAAKYKKFADLIMANLYNNNDFISKIEVLDWETNETISIPLNKDLTLKENSQKYYNLYSKSKSAKEKLTELQELSVIRCEYFEGILYSVERSETLTELYEILSECEDLGLVKKQEQKIKKEFVVTMININGFNVYIGKNNKQNDYIVSKIAAPDDIWFHTQNCTGSHVLLQINENRVPDEETVYECCKLAKHYSKASNDKKVGVIYTKRKYLKKPPKSNLGYVTYKNEHEIIVSE